jgi:hypothetical protein
MDGPRGAPVPRRTFVPAFHGVTEVFLAAPCGRLPNFRTPREAKIESRPIKYTAEGEICPTTKEDLEEVTRWLIRYNRRAAEGRPALDQGAPEGNANRAEGLGRRLRKKQLPSQGVR